MNSEPVTPRYGAIVVLTTILAVIVLASPAVACTVASTPLAFGEIDPLMAQPTDSVGTITVSCPGATAYSIAIDTGSGRYMTSGVNELEYRLYSEASHSTEWGDGAGGTTKVSGQAGPEDSSHNIYGRVPAQPYAVPGTYSTLLLVTITY